MITGILVLVLRILLAVALYAFLGWALWVLWRELNLHLQQVSREQVPPIVLEVVSEQESEERRYQFSEREVLLGRHPSCQIVLNDETVSTRHARLRYRDHQWWVEDLHSTNGTFLNDERVMTPTIVVSGDIVRCGQALLRIQIQSQE